MFVSAEIITIVLSTVGLLLTLGGTMVAGFGWCIRRTDRLEERLGARIDGLDDKLGARIDGVEERLGARIDGVRADLAEVERSLGARIDGVAADTTELKIAMARIEGPQRHLIVAAR